MYVHMACTSSTPPLQYFSCADGARLAYRLYSPHQENIATHKSTIQPAVAYFPGYNSDMSSTKAQAVAAWAVRTGKACLLFDHFGHGESDGRLTDGTVSRWLLDSSNLLKHALASHPMSRDVVIVAASMGTWLAVLLARQWQQQQQQQFCIRGIVGVGSAPDFTELLWHSLSDSDKSIIQRQGVVRVSSRFSAEPYTYSWQLLQDAKQHLLLQANRESLNSDVPYKYSMQLAKVIEAPSLLLTLVKDGDHRLSRPQDIARLISSLHLMCTSF
eukprot:jgi/Chlat1/1199/Chrsp115S01655